MHGLVFYMKEGLPFAPDSSLESSGDSYLRQSFQEWTKQNLWKTAFKKFQAIWSA